MTDYTFAGARATGLRLIMPLYGLWAADVVLASEAPIPTVADTLRIGGLALVGTSLRTAPFAGARTARLVGGFGGWHKPVDAQAYLGSSVRVSTVLKDAAAAVGEHVSVDVNDTPLGRFTREHGPASQVLRQVAGLLWWVAPDGVTHVGPRARAGVPITSDFDVLEWSGALGRFTIATEVLADWLPGRTFSAPTVAGTQTISYTDVTMDNAGKLRVEVLASS